MTDRNGGRRRAGAVSLAVLTLSVAAPSAGAQDVRDGIRRRVQGVVDSIVAEGVVPGIQVGLAFDDGTHFAVVSGFADREASRAMTSRDRLLAGSTGKTFFAATALQLVQEGRLDLDAPISTYLGGEPWFDRFPNASGATVRMLLNHTSGIVRYEFTEAFARDLTAEPDRVWEPEDLLAYLLDTEAPFAPGEGWTYSDTNYILLAMILERVTGRAAYDEIRTRFLEPLGLDGTVPSDSRRIAGLAQGYAGPGNPFGGTDAMIRDGLFAINPQFEWGGGGFATTAEDLARWAVALFGGGSVVSDPALRAAQLRGVEAPALGPGAAYGLGVILRGTPAGPALGHSGFFPGYLTDVRYYPELGAAIAVQVNASTAAARRAMSGLPTGLATIVAGGRAGRIRPAA